MSPDVSLVSGFWFGDFARTGIFLPVDQWLRGTSVSISDFYQGSAEQAKFEGQYYAIPFAGGPQRALWYKVSIFEEVGLNPHDRKRQIAPTLRRRVRAPILLVRPMVWEALGCEPSRAT